MANPFVYLFWKTQISALHACPPLGGFIADSSLGAQNTPKIWVKTLFGIAAQAPRIIISKMCDQRKGRIVMSRVTICITTRCTLNCDKCAVHVPDIKRPGDIPLSNLIRDIQTLLACVDHIYAVVLSGGETFLHPDLDEIIRVCADSGKVGRISMVTNGTVIPEARALAALRESKVMVNISMYPPPLQPDVEKLKAVLKENGICYKHESGAAWSDLGDFGQRKEGLERRRFSLCVQQLCFPLVNGKLHRCGESAILSEEGLMADCKEDFIDLRAISPADFPAQWKKLLKKRAVSACSYCWGDTYKSPKIPPAVQR